MSPPPEQNQMKHLKRSSNWRSKLLVRGGVAPAVDSSSSDDDNFTDSISGNPIVRGVVSYRPLELPLMHHPRWLPGKPVALSFPAALAAIFRSIFPPLQALIPTCQRLSLKPLPYSSTACVGRKRVTGTLFGRRNGRVSFTVQEDPSIEPALILELPTLTCQLVKEMAAGTVRILLECERRHRTTTVKKRHLSPPLWAEPVWSMTCNGRRAGFAVSRECSESDRRVFQTVQAVSAGAGLIPPLAPPLVESGKGNLGFPSDGGGGLEVLFMRANFERVVGSKDSEAFYMMSPEGGGWKCSSASCGPELSIFLLRL